MQHDAPVTEVIPRMLICKLNLSTARTQIIAGRMLNRRPHSGNNARTEEGMRCLLMMHPAYAVPLIPVQTRRLARTHLKTRKFAHPARAVGAAGNQGRACGTEHAPTPRLRQIRSSYRKKVLLNHPDRNKNSPDKALKFLEVQEAWDVLGNNDARASYDNFLDKCQNSELVAEQEALLKHEQAAMQREQEEADKAAGWNFGRPATGGGGGSRYGFFGAKRNK